ncbi:MAG: CIA30 family protein [Pseudomonadota bacterium]
MKQMKLTTLIVTIMTILPFATTSTAATAASLLTHFDDLPGELRWNVVNDNVMGGRSRGGYEIEDGILRFTGATNTRGGGFSSLRTSRAQLPFTADTDGVAMRMKGDFRTYIFRVETRDGYTYWADVPTRSDWQNVAIPFENFTLRWRGYQRRGPALKPENIDSLGLMIYDNRDGPFRLEVDWISTWQR